MTSKYRSQAASAVLLFLLGTCPAQVAASDEETLTRVLEEFLAAAHVEAAHARFWADELIYTSSAGARFGKAEIMESFAAQGDKDQAAEPSVAYSADEIDVRVYETTAIVAFRLVSTPADGSGVQRYFNTGTFLKRDGSWSVVAWQATKIPPVSGGD